MRFNFTSLFIYKIDTEKEKWSFEVLIRSNKHLFFYNSYYIFFKHIYCKNSSFHSIRIKLFKPISLDIIINEVRNNITYTSVSEV